MVLLIQDWQHGMNMQEVLLHELIESGPMRDNEASLAGEKGEVLRQKALSVGSL